MIMLCPHCNKKLNIADELAGHDRTCPACHKAIKIPGLATGSARRPLGTVARFAATYSRAARARAQR